MIAELKKLRREIKRALIARDVQAARKKGKASSLYHFQREFGSFPLAIAAAGAGRTRFSADKLKIYLKKLESELGRAPTGRDITARFIPGETPSLKEVRRVFGNLTNARKSV